MLEGTKIRLDIFTPTLDAPIARTGTVRISDDKAEFENAAYYDLSNGDPYFVVPARLDVTGATLSYKVLEGSGYFVNVDDDTGFNGYAMTFLGLRANPAVSIHSVKVIGHSNTLEIPVENMSFNRDTIFVNVDGLHYDVDEGVAARIGFRINGGIRANKLTGEEGDDLLLGRGGADRLSGSGGADMLLGGSGADRLAGGAGNDRLSGGAGRDRLDGGQGNDLLTGGGGADVFVFANRFGRDRIADFNEDLRGERIDLGNVAQIQNFRDLRDNHLSERGGDAIITAGAGNVIRLTDVDAADLSANDFIF